MLMLLVVHCAEILGTQKIAIPCFIRQLALQFLMLTMLRMMDGSLWGTRGWQERLGLGLFRFLHQAKAQKEHYRQVRQLV
jgi:hypothetical protein